jgi:hypothetical protein
VARGRAAVGRHPVRPGPDRVDGLVEAILEHLFEVDDMAPEGHPPGESDLAAQARCLGLLGAMLRDLSPFGYQPADKRYERLKKNVMAIFDPAGAGQVPLEIRISAAEALGRAGDPRPGVGLMPDHHGIPDVLWCDIPAGTLQMGSFAGEEGVRKDEIRPGGKPLPVPVAAFRIAAYPVTCAQFRPFVEGDGYKNQAYWTKAGWEWRGPKSAEALSLGRSPLEHRQSSGGRSHLVRGGGLVPLVHRSAAGAGLLGPDPRDPPADRIRVGMGRPRSGWAQISLGRCLVGRRL